MKFLGLLLFVFVFGVHATAWADCSNPAGQEGSIFYNTTNNVVQFCDGTNWWDTGLANSSAAATGCSNPTGQEGAVFYNTSHNVMQFCNGEAWINMGDTLWTAAAQTGCSTPTATAGTLFYNTSVQRVQFCNGENWVNAVHTVLAGGAPQVQGLWSGGQNYHSCALIENGTVKCWGDNTYGQLGDGSTTDSATPVSVSGINNATALALGGSHSCALLADSTVKCWGSNTSGRLGNGTTTQSTTPVSVNGVTTAIALDVGHGHSCVLLGNNTLQCWGYNNNGQLGDNSTTTSTVPVTVDGISNAIALALGYAHTCALLNDSTLKCWGWNVYGQLGNGTTATRVLIPVSVNGISTASAIALGNGHSCALLNDNTVQCWGFNYYGQLGDGTTTSPRLAPVNVSGISTATAVALGENHSCALLSDNTLRCWGQNPYGQLGDGTSGTNRDVAVSVSGVNTAAVLSVGRYYGCALLSDKSVRCWGRNNYGQLGDTTTTNRLTPVSVTGLP